MLGGPRPSCTPHQSAAQTGSPLEVEAYYDDYNDDDDDMTLVAMMLMNGSLYRQEWAFATNSDELRLKHVHKVLLFLGVVNIIHCYLKCYQIILVPISVQYGTHLR